MELKSNQQEILLITGTSFSSRHCYQKEDPENPDHLSEIEQLEEACWNGLLGEMLPEICAKPANKKIYLWQIKEACSFIEIELGELPKEKEKYFSIDPYTFLPIRLLS